VIPTTVALKLLDTCAILLFVMTRQRRGLHAKARGELTEIRFLLMAASCGLIVCKPWGESQPFDFIVYCKRSRRFYRIQVKSSSFRRRSNYQVTTSHRSAARSRYSAREIDFLAAYVIPEDAWYIVPVRALGGRKLIGVYPHNPQSRGMFEKYRDRWQLLRK
jgi:hypothetical protein